MEKSKQQQQQQQQQQQEQEQEPVYHHFVVLDEKQAAFDEFLKKPGIIDMDYLYCTHHHRHYVIQFRRDVNFREEPVCARPLSAEHMTLFCKVFQSIYREVNYLVDS
jgi:hypothetical protein